MSTDLEAQIQSAAKRLFDGHKAGAAYLSVAETDGISGIAQGYDVQDRLVDMLLRDSGASVAGYKIALTSKPMQEMVGVDHPVAGVVLDRVVFSSGARVKLSDYQHIGVEFELAVRLGRDMPAKASPYTRAETAELVDACAPAFELVDDRNADYTALEGVGLAADNAWNGGVVVGAFSTAWRDLDLTSVRARLEWSGAEDAAATTGEAMGHPFEAVAWIANHLNARGQMLKAGEFVMTGSTMKTRFPTGGERIRYTLEGMGAVAAEIV